MAVQDLYITNHLKYEIFIQVLSIFHYAYTLLLSFKSKVDLADFG